MFYDNENKVTHQLELTRSATKWGWFCPFIREVKIYYGVVGQPYKYEFVDWEEPFFIKSRNYNYTVVQPTKYSDLPLWVKMICPFLMWLCKRRCPYKNGFALRQYYYRNGKNFFDVVIDHACQTIRYIRRYQTTGSVEDIHSYKITRNGSVTYLPKAEWFKLDDMYIMEKQKQQLEDAVGYPLEEFDETDWAYAKLIL